MKTEIVFNTPQEAVDYARQWNPKIQTVIEPALKNGDIKNRLALRFVMSFAGVEGYPVECLADMYNLPE